METTLQVTVSLSDGNSAGWAAAVCVEALDVEAVLSVGTEVSDDRAASLRIRHNVRLVVVGRRIVLLQVDHETVDRNTLFGIILLPHTQ